MPKTVKITATTPYGIQTRTTARTYTHMIMVGAKHDANIIAGFEQSLKWNTKEAAKYAAAVAKGEVPAAYASSCTLEDYARWGAEHAAKVASHEVDLAAALEANRAAIANKFLRAETWCGRPDLAEKAAAMLRKTYYYVEIYPVD